MNRQAILGELDREGITMIVEVDERADEMRQTYEEYGSEAFEMFDCDGIDNAEIAEVLGRDVAREFENWIYFNVK